MDGPSVPSRGLAQAYETGDGDGTRSERYRQHHDGHETTYKQAKRSVMSAHG
jgi:hypothetical protein